MVGLQYEAEGRGQKAGEFLVFGCWLLEGKRQRAEGRGQKAEGRRVFSFWLLVVRR
jgi:hypothetical protein